MNLGELLTELRVSRLDDNVPQYLWSDAELTGYLNEAVRQVCIRKRALLEAVNTKVCRIPFGIGQRFLKLHPAVISVRHASIARTDDFPDGGRLVGITAQRLEKSRDNWINETDHHCIRHWIPDVQEGHLAFDGLPEAAGTLQLHVWRFPLDTEKMEGMDDEPVINENWHIDLCDWAEYLAFRKKDAETLDTGRGEKAAAKFTAKVGRLPSMTEVRIWGIQPITSTIPEFL